MSNDLSSLRHITNTTVNIRRLDVRQVAEIMGLAANYARLACFRSSKN